MMHQQQMQQMQMQQAMQQQSAAPAAAPVINITSNNTNTNENNNSGGGGDKKDSGSAAPKSGIWTGPAKLHEDCCVPAKQWTQELVIYFYPHHAILGHSTCEETIHAEFGKFYWEMEDGSWQPDGTVTFKGKTPDKDLPFTCELKCLGGPAGNIMEGTWSCDTDERFNGTMELTFLTEQNEATVHNGQKKVRTMVEKTEKCTIM